VISTVIIKSFARVTFPSVDEFTTHYSSHRAGTRVQFPTSTNWLLKVALNTITLTLYCRTISGSPSYDDAHGHKYGEPYKVPMVVASEETLNGVPGENLRPFASH
jgi:hypothetical protein